MKNTNDEYVIRGKFKSECAMSNVYVSKENPDRARRQRNHLTLLFIQKINGIGIYLIRQRYKHSNHTVLRKSKHKYIDDLIHHTSQVWSDSLVDMACRERINLHRKQKSNLHIPYNTQERKSECTISSPDLLIWLKWN